MKHRTLLILAFVTGYHIAHTQGCIPIRNLVGFGQFILPEANQNSQEPVQWLVNVNSRYLHSIDTYDGTKKITSPAENHIYETNFNVTRLYSRGWSFSLDVPVMAGDRTSSYEHGGTGPRYTTRTFGLGDVRLTAYKWLFKVSTPHRGNIQLGLGLKLPTGDYRSTDYFHKDILNPSNMTIAPANASIQPGDGGTGILFEVNSFYSLTKVISLYGNVFYLSNPRDQNGVSALNGGVPVYPAVESTATTYSVPDAYTMRAGANFGVKSFTFWLGGRKEGTPVHDFIGASHGVRRAGTSMSVEPGINYKFSRSIVYAFVPITVYRNGEQTVPDKTKSDLLGTRFGSPGGFANYLIFVGVMVKL